jgi:hypothetical protein
MKAVDAALSLCDRLTPMKIRTTYLVAFLPWVFVAGSSLARKGPKYGSVNFESLSQKQGFNFEKDGRDPIGFVNTLTIGTATIEADLELRQPTASRPSGSKSVGVLGRIAWGGGSSDPIELTAYISTKNCHRIEQLLHERPADTSVQIDFVVYNYDPAAKKYFKAFYPNVVPLHALIRKTSGELQLKLGEKGGEVANPENWTLSIVIVPPAEVAQLTYAVPNSAPTDKTWGASGAY